MSTAKPPPVVRACRAYAAGQVALAWSGKHKPYKLQDLLGVACAVSSTPTRSGGAFPTPPARVSTFIASPPGFAAAWPRWPPAIGASTASGKPSVVANRSPPGRARPCLGRRPKRCLLQTVALTMIDVDQHAERLGAVVRNPTTSTAAIAARFVKQRGRAWPTRGCRGRPDLPRPGSSAGAGFTGRRARSGRARPLTTMHLKCSCCSSRPRDDQRRTWSTNTTTHAEPG